jgi:hypothetical protein
MRITAVSHAVLVAVLVVVASGVALVTGGIAATKSDRDAASRHCMALARHGRTLPARPSSAILMRHSAVYNECMTQAGFGLGRAGTK